MLDVPGTRFRRVVESHESWRARMAALAKTEDAKLESERRREIASIAGKAAAASPRHVSKRRRAAPVARRAPRI
jgi:predicted secreted protein